MIIKRTENSGYVQVTEYHHLKTGQKHTESLIHFLDLETFKFGKYHVNTEYRLFLVELKRIPVLVQRFDKSSVVLNEKETCEEIEIPLKWISGKSLKYGESLILVKDAENVKIVKIVTE